MSGSAISTKTIYDMLGEKFLIPSYQRGYRWDSLQVTALLDDIWQFCNKVRNLQEKQFYCLQPIVVHKKDGVWHIVDGQQRLTTIRIILTFLDKELLHNEFEAEYKRQIFSIDYQTRNATFKDYLDTFDEAIKDKNVDFSHIFNAKETISNWFREKTRTEKNKFIDVLLAKEDEDHPVKVIWYDMTALCADEHYAIDVFTRINIGKIQLTNAELIKALFLIRVDHYVPSHEGNEKQRDDSTRYLKQLQIASEWDGIENRLQDNDFWYFIWDQKISYETRIEYIFDLISDNNVKKNDDSHYTFHVFNEKLQELKIDEVWLEVKNYYQLISDWYENPTLYHYIGFLIQIGIPISEILELNEKQPKSKFMDLLKDKIKKLFDFQIEDLSYDGDSEKIRRVLLLFNIQSLLSSGKSVQRFPFELYKENHWDLEHIRSQNPQTLEPRRQGPWLRQMLSYFTGSNADSQDTLTSTRSYEKKLEGPEKLLVERILALLQTSEINQADFASVKDDIFKYFDGLGNHDDIKDPDNISNLALLDFATNRSYQNSPFPVKRKVIMERDGQGVFIPLGTKNVFLKGYSTKISDLLSWNQCDADDYLQTIKAVLSPFLNNGIRIDEVNK